MFHVVSCECFVEVSVTENAIMLDRIFFGSKTPFQ